MKQIVIEIDPCEYHVDKGATYESLARACGVLPLWALASIGTPKNMKDQCLEMYQFPIMTLSGVVDDKGIYKYPEDPPLIPYMKLSNGEEVAYFYAHAIVAFVHGGAQFVTRMD